jgi:hypothetical protein
MMKQVNEVVLWMSLWQVQSMWLLKKNMDIKQAISIQIYMNVWGMDLVKFFHELAKTHSKNMVQL